MYNKCQQLTQDTEKRNTKDGVKNVHRVFSDTAQVTAKHRQNTNLLNVPTENVSKHQVHILSATERRESVQVIRDVSEHCQAVI